MAERQTAGRDQLGDFAPEFAELSDDALFGQVWSRGELSAHQHSIIIMSALISGGNFEQLSAYLKIDKQSGVTSEEIAEIVTHLAFYVGRPRAWLVFSLAREIYLEESSEDKKRA